MKHLPTTNRRSAIRQMGAVAACAAISSMRGGFAAEPIKRTGMRLVIYDCSIRRKWMRQQKSGIDLFKPLVFLKHCHSVGAGGMQANLGVMKPSDIGELRDFAAQNEMFIDAIISHADSSST